MINQKHEHVTHVQHRTEANPTNDETQWSKPNLSSNRTHWSKANRRRNKLEIKLGPRGGGAKHVEKGPNDVLVLFPLFLRACGYAESESGTGSVGIICDSDLMYSM